MSDYSRADMSYAVRLANRRYDEDMIFRALAKKPSGRRDPGSMKYQRILEKKGRDAADAYARATATKALRFVADSPPILDKAGALVWITETKALVDALPWGVYAGPRTRRALEGAFVVAERVGGVSFGLALREWAEICGMDMRTIRTERDRLVSFGWLRRNPDDRPGRTARYSLQTPPHIHSHLRSECAGVSGRAWLAHDAFREAVTGDASWYVLATLDGLALTLSELKAQCGMDAEVVRDLIAILDHAGLVNVRGSSVTAVADPIPRLDDLAQRRGTFGMASEDRRRHEAERVAYRARGVNVRDLEAP